MKLKNHRTTVAKGGTIFEIQEENSIKKLLKLLKKFLKKVSFKSNKNLLDFVV